MGPTHIEKFGGDPANVTIFGEFAGAGNVGYLIASPLADELFPYKPVDGRSSRLERWSSMNDGQAPEKIGLGIAELRELDATDLLEQSQKQYSRGYSALEYDPPLTVGFCLIPWPKVSA